VTEPAGLLDATKRLSRRKIAISTAIAVLVLGGIGTTVYFLTRADDKPAASQGNAGGAGAAPDGKQSGATPAGNPPAAGPSAAEAGNAKQVAQQAVQAFNAHDLQAMKKISCDPGAVPDNLLPETKVELVGDPELTGDAGTVELKVMMGDQSTTTPLPLLKHNGVWCVN